MVLYTLLFDVNTILYYNFYYDGETKRNVLLIVFLMYSKHGQL